MTEENIEDFNNLDNYELKDSDTPCKKIKIFITIISVTLILATVLIILFFILKDNKDDNKIKQFSDIDIIDYSFIAEYYSDGKYTTKLIANDYLTNINELIIDGKITKPYSQYKFNSTGIHRVYFKMNISNLTSLVGMFCNIHNVTLISFSSLFNTENITAMTGMFAYCYKLTSLDVSNFNTKKVTSMFIMFTSCYSLTSLNVSNFNTENVKDMSSMFSYLISLTSLDLSNFKTPNLEKMLLTFSGCEKLTSLDLSSFNTTKLLTLESTFYGCSSLETINLSSFNTPNLKKMANMFYQCYSLKSIDLSSFNTTNLLNLNRLFYQCISLTSINLKNFNISARNGFSGEYFKGCKNITYIDISSFWTSESELILFDQLPSKGEIIVNASLIDKIRNHIPDEWNITVIE